MRVRPGGRTWKVLAVSVVALGCGGVVTAAAMAGSGSSRPAARTAPTVTAGPTRTSAPAPPTTRPAPTHAVPDRVVAAPKKRRAEVPAARRPAVPPPTTTTTTTTTSAATAGSPATLAGCPVPPHPPLPPAPPPWHPAVLVPGADLPAVEPPSPWRSDLLPITGKGMWIWEWDQTAGGDASAVVQQAQRAGLHQLWVRVADSKDGFYGAQELDSIVPVAHRAGLAVIAWGFPYLYDPVGDARWTTQVLDWRGPGGQEVDGYSADLEQPTEGVMMTAQRAAVYLELVRRAAGARPVVATVYPATDANWYGSYPYTAMAPYVDAFAPMVYWECSDPGSDAAMETARLSALRPVHLIGEAFNFADVGGRTVSPSAAEISEFLSSGRRAGALGASFWVWQDATPQEWTALTAYPWPAAR